MPGERSSSRVTTKRLRNGGNRRSPRLTAAAAKPTNSTSRLGRRRTGDERASNVEQGDDDDDDDDDDDEGCDRDDGKCEANVTGKGERKDMCSTSQQLPEKGVLELVIDILQRRDTYDAFGQPIDPDEVGDYYQVVKEPMDFGTMRAKLHEGIYSSLEEFEHDAFLVPQNAKLFNSPSSVYFKQAQAIEELAKKVFHLLKTEPEKLRTDFSGTRRRSRRLPPESINGKSKQGSSSNEQPQNMNFLHKPSLSTSLYADKASTTFTSFNSEDARSTYQPWICFSRESDSTFSTVYKSSKLLKEIRVGDTEMQYRDSLLRFVQGLGPIAQKIATRKLQPQARVPTRSQVELQPATFQYPDPAISPTPEPSMFPSTLTSSSIPNKFSIPSQDPFTLAKNAEVQCHVSQVHIGGNATTGFSTSMTGTITGAIPGTEGNGIPQMSGSEKAAAQESHRDGICLAIGSENYSKMQARPTRRM